MPASTHLVLSLESKPGVLGKVARVLADAGVNVTGVSTSDAAGSGKIRLLVSDAARARDALKAAKYRVSEEPVLVVPLDNRPGALAGVAEKLGQARINIKQAYATAGDAGRVNLVLVVSNPGKAAGIVGAG